MRRSCVWALGAILWAATLARGQSASLEVRNGRAYINGHEAVPGAIPEGLDLRGLNGIRIVLAGPNSWGIFTDRGGRRWAFSVDGRLRPAEALEGASPRARFVNPFPFGPGLLGQEIPEQELAAQRARLQAWETQMQALEVQLDQLLARYHRLLGESYANQIPAEQVRALEGRLRNHLNELFELQQRLYQRQIQSLQQELERLNRTLEERQRLREQIIERRLRELLGGRRNGGE